MIMDINKLSSRIIGAAIEVHKTHGLVCLNFNVTIMKDGIVQIVNELKE